MNKQFNKLYLDDIRTPIDENWDVVRNYDEFCEYILKTGLENIECISFDHDLGDTAMDEYYNNAKPNYQINYDNITEKTGYDCVKWLVTHSIDTGVVIPKVYVHSANPIGAANMMGYINNYYKNFRVPVKAEIMVWPHTY